MSDYTATIAWIRNGESFTDNKYSRAHIAGERRPSADEHRAMHHEAHEQCFIARSVKTDVRCEPVDATAA